MFSPRSKENGLGLGLDQDQTGPRRWPASTGSPLRFAWRARLPLECDDVLRTVIPLYLFVWHDLGANVSRLSQEKTGTHRVGSCSGIPIRERGIEPCQRR